MGCWQCALTNFDQPLDRIPPWLDVLARPLDEDTGRPWGADAPTIHQDPHPLDGLPFDDRVIYICALPSGNAHERF